MPAPCQTANGPEDLRVAVPVVPQDLVARAIQQDIDGDDRKNQLVDPLQAEQPPREHPDRGHQVGDNPSDHDLVHLRYPGIRHQGDGQLAEAGQRHAPLLQFTHHGVGLHGHSLPTSSPLVDRSSGAGHEPGGIRSLSPPLRSGGCYSPLDPPCSTRRSLLSGRAHSLRVASRKPQHGSQRTGPPAQPGPLRCASGPTPAASPGRRPRWPRRRCRGWRSRLAAPADGGQGAGPAPGGPARAGTTPPRPRCRR